MKQPDILISHLRQDAATGDWVLQTNEEHSEGVAALCERFASAFGLGSFGRLLGLLHDRGKERRDFQRYIRRNSGFDPGAGPYDDKSHAAIGAVLVSEVANTCGMLENCIAGHHAGLYDLHELRAKLKETAIPDEVSGSAPGFSADSLKCVKTEDDVQHVTRMLYSCLVDADFLDTERFMNAEAAAERGRFASLPELKARLDSFLESLATKPATPLNAIRAQVQELCREAATMDPGFFELTVPTGGGKTIASVVWALNHAIAHGKERVVIAIPYTSIVVQTAQTLRDIFGPENVVEHHSVMDDSDKPIPASDAKDKEKAEMRRRNRLATENWDAPIIVTTNVQLFESMFASRPSRCRKLHSLAQSVVILDEAQTLPLGFLQPIINAMRVYAKCFGASFLFCTASQPVLTGERKGSGRARLEGIPVEQVRAIVPASMGLHERLRRASLRFESEKTTPDEMACRLAAMDRVLCVVNTRALAREVYEALPQSDDNFHLSRMMCPKHIAETIAEVKARLNDERAKVRVVSTQLIEAGVDIDFPVVFRQMAGLDSLLQSAGRCNREGKLESAETMVFDFEGFKARGSMADAAYAMQERLSLEPDSDWMAPEAMNDYFKTLYRRTSTFDKKDIKSMVRWFDEIDYEKIGLAFHLIDDAGVPVVVNYGEAPQLIKQLETEGPTRSLMRKLSLYTVTISPSMMKTFEAAGLVKQPWTDVNYIELRDQYDPKLGLKVNNEYLEQMLVI